MAGETPEFEVCVVVVNWNRRDLLRACLASLAGQREARFEVIVVDNGSTDGSPAMVRGEFGGLPLRLIENRENRGFCGANNQGIAASRAPYIALLNNDAEADSRWLAELLDVLRRHPRAGMAASKILVHDDPRRIDKAGHLIWRDGQNRGRGHGQLDLGQFDREESVLWPDGCAAIYRRAMIDEVGPFDEDFFAYADDADLGLRGRIAGWDCVYNPRAVVRHHRAATLGRQSAGRLRLIERNRVWLVAKLFPWRLLLLNPFYYTARLAHGLWSAARGRGEAGQHASKWTLARTLLLADLEALAGLPRMLRKRREMKRFRRLSGAEVADLIERHRIPLAELNGQAS